MSARARCLAAALDLMASDGFNGTSMRDIARAAETSLSNLYNHFSSKSDVLVALLRDANDELLRRIRAELDTAGPGATERMAAGVRAYVTFSGECQTAAVLALSEFRYLRGEGRLAVVEARDTTESIFRRVIVDGVRTGEFRTPHPDGATRAIVSVCAAVPTWYRPDGPLSLAELADVHVRYVLAMLEASSVAARRPTAAEAGG
ncbi:TetR family transcriptional regulator [Geodermatophilus sp. DSM 44513]|uniref:TetR/AcrR family transcriptional regulator n=1 Tax=Geodermatophilus sp. DSM 44513 TaxID=1528104 RepID=UPI001277FD86|nr:TetR family transcriptional regulator [Geodermatophilus sp. DSM 44513]WNV76624.1 TetR/AcrR family transcriptional regulator [Geodermatophilus sp. DSM 44513]